MELIIVRDGHIFARATDSSTEQHSYELRTVASADMPAYPSDGPGKGKYYELDYVEGVLQWITKDRPLTTEERIEAMQAQLDEIVYPAWKQPTGAHDCYKIGAKVSHNGKKWVCTASDGSGNNSWEPGVYGWEEV